MNRSIITTVRVRGSDGHKKLTCSHGFRYRVRTYCKFAGRPDDISARTFLDTLHGITTVVQEANRELGTGDPLDVRIRAPRPGSFLVHLLLDPVAVSTIATLFTAHNLEFAKNLIDVVTAAIDLRRFLKGEKPAAVTQSGSTVTIENASGNTIIQDNRVYNFVVNNAVANAALDRAFSALDADANVTALDVLDKDERRLLSIPRDDFPEMTSSGDLLTGSKRSLVVSARLSIVKLSFEPKLKWEFVYNGIRIAALVEDPNFYAAIDNREAFVKGDVLDVDLRIQQEYDDRTRAFMNRGYVVSHVKRHIEIAEQRKLVTRSTPRLPVKDQKRVRPRTKSAGGRTRRPRNR